MKCNHKGCNKEAVWEIEVFMPKQSSLNYYLIHSCDEHCIDPELLNPSTDSIRRINHAALENLDS